MPNLSGLYICEKPASCVRVSELGVSLLVLYAVCVTAGGARTSWKEEVLPYIREIKWVRVYCVHNVFYSNFRSVRRVYMNTQVIGVTIVCLSLLKVNIPKIVH